MYRLNFWSPRTRSSTKARPHSHTAHTRRRAAPRASPARIKYINYDSRALSGTVRLRGRSELESDSGNSYEIFSHF